MGLAEKWESKPAVSAADVVWENHSGYSPLSRLLRRAFVKAMTALLILFFSIPTAFAVSLANLTTLSKLPGYQWLEALIGIQVVRGFVEGFIPSIIVFLSFELLLLVLRILASFQVHRTRSNQDRVVMRHFFAFQVVNIFLASLLAGTFLSITYELVRFVMEPIEIVWLLAERLPGQVNYFVGYIVLNSVIRHVIALVRPLDLVIYGLKRCFGKKTSADPQNHNEAPHSRMPQFDYAYFVATDLLVFLIAITYSTLAPLLTSVFGLLYFAFAYMSARYNIIWVYHQPYQAWGRMWPDIYHCIMGSVLLYQFTLFGLFALNVFATGAAMCLVCIIGTIICWRDTHKRNAHIMKVRIMLIVSRDGLILILSPMNVQFGAFDTVDYKGFVLPADIDAQTNKPPNLGDEELGRENSVEDIRSSVAEEGPGGEVDGDEDSFKLSYVDPLLKSNYPHQTIE
jgi:hypothetical protein